ncbi:rhomboid family intramembrane serine protease [Anaeroselena agilis]|uniref:Rhomboid family intramembrane serine protease n=1 Tax=Anaeroselena agilis TaxID=3063788 RepID=A0ABU3NUA9_9FIRM|nr:rhomboid family intramembrane serine protease [Selenomonadales bacterium 4137-cl]
MFPLRDNIPSRSRPLVTVALIVANFYFFYQELILGEAALGGFIKTWGLVPADFIARFAREPFQYATYLPLVSNLFLHGGWMHILGNMWYLWIFGDNIEDCLGKIRFFLFYVLCGVIANAAQIIVDPGSTIPTIGASGAISGVLGGYLMLFPRARIATLIPLFPIFPILQIPALLFLPLWFFIQLQQGALALFTAGAGIAWWAHIGGFAAGFLLVRIFKA